MGEHYGKKDIESYFLAIPQIFRVVG